MIKNLACKRCRCCREQQWAGLPGDICLYLRGSGCQRFPHCNEKEVNITQACKLLPCANTSGKPLFFCLPSPNACFPSDILFSPACSLGSFVFSSDSLRTSQDIFAEQQIPGYWRQSRKAGVAKKVALEIESR